MGGGCFTWFPSLQHSDSHQPRRGIVRPNKALQRTLRVARFARPLVPLNAKPLGHKSILIPNSVTVDLITRRLDGSFVLVVVEEGPWSDLEMTRRLRSLQDRLHACLDLILSGALARRFPESLDQPVTVRVDAYGTPRLETEAFLSNYQQYVAHCPEVLDFLPTSRVPAIHFEYHWRSST
jgi:hypothetical protein